MQRELNKVFLDEEKLLSKYFRRRPTKFNIESRVTTPVVFGGIYHPFRRALSSVVGLYNATCIYPDVLKTILGSSFCAEPDFGITSLVLPSTSCQLVISDFFVVCPGVGENSIRREVVGIESG